MCKKKKHIYIEKFISWEIEEMAKLNNFRYDIIKTLFYNTKLDIRDLKKIENREDRSVTYELLVLFPQNNDFWLLVHIIKNDLPNLHLKKEKGYLIESKELSKIREIFEHFNGNNEDFFYTKLAFIVARRLFFISSDNIEFGQTDKTELSSIIQQIYSDINLYFITLKIHLKFEKNLNERTVKSIILRTIVRLCDQHDKIEISLQKVAEKSVYFLKSHYFNAEFLHFYARILFCPAKIIFWKNWGLNGGAHYLNKRKIIEASIYNSFVEIVPDIMNFVDKQNKIGFLLDKKMLNFNKTFVKEQLEKSQSVDKEWAAYFSGIDDLDEKEISQVLILQNLKLKIKEAHFIKEIDNEAELLKAETALSTLMEKNSSKILKKKAELDKKIIYLKDLIKKGKLKFNPKYHNRWLQRDFSYSFILKIYLDFISFFKEYNDALFFTLFFDFRGRHYHSSLVAPSQGWPFRFSYTFDKTVQITQKSERLLFDLEKYKNIFKILESQIGILNNQQKEASLWILLSIGSLDINKKKEIREEEFIEKGLTYFLERHRLNKNLENSEINYYCFALEDVKINESNRYVMKDVSGSIFQNASLILGFKNIESLEWLNLNGETWKDPYHPLITEMQKDVPDHLKKFFNRKTLKKSIMTKYYNAKLFKSFYYFMKEVRKIEGYDDSMHLSLWREYKEVFNKLKSLEKKLLFANSNTDYERFLDENKIEKIEYSDFCFNILTYSLISKRIDITEKNKRITLTIKEPSQAIYKSKLINSRIPNVFHGEDGYRARLLINACPYEIFAIHDAFAVHPFNITNFVITANALFDLNDKKYFYMHNNNIIVEKFSKFIFL